MQRFHMCASADSWPAPFLCQHLQVTVCAACTVYSHWFLTFECVPVLMAGLLPSSASTCRLRWTLGTRAAAAAISCCSCCSASVWPAAGEQLNPCVGLRQDLRGLIGLSCARGILINDMLDAGNKSVSCNDELLQLLQRLTMACRREGHGEYCMR